MRDRSRAPLVVLVALLALATGNSALGNESICPRGPTSSGVDVSDYQKGTNWETVAHAGPGFAYVKATEGNDFISPAFSTDYPAVTRSGLVRGPYHYFHPSEDPVAQAEFFLSAVGNFESADLPAMLDWEVTDGVKSETSIRNGLVWLEKIRSATGKTPVIYTYASFWNSLGDPSEFAQYPLFIGDYNVTCPLVPAPWSGWVFWQRTDSARISGIGGTTGVDLDEFNGSRSALKVFATTGVY